MSLTDTDKEQIEFMIENKFNEYFKKINSRLWTLVGSSIFVVISAAFILGVRFSSATSKIDNLAEKVAEHDSQLKEKMDYKTFLQYVDLINEKFNSRDDRAKQIMKDIDDMNQAIKTVQPQYRGIRITKNNDYE